MDDRARLDAVLLSTSLNYCVHRRGRLPEIHIPVKILAGRKWLEKLLFRAVFHAVEAFLPALRIGISHIGLNLLEQGIHVFLSV